MANVLIESLEKFSPNEGNASVDADDEESFIEVVFTWFD